MWKHYLQHWFILVHILDSWLFRAKDLPAPYTFWKCKEQVWWHQFWPTLWTAGQMWLAKIHIIISFTATVKQDLLPQHLAHSLYLFRPEVGDSLENSYSLLQSEAHRPLCWAGRRLRSFLLAPLPGRALTRQTQPQVKAEHLDPYPGSRQISFTSCPGGHVREVIKGVNNIGNLNGALEGKNSKNINL